jgi:hypothetical protein
MNELGEIESHVEDLYYKLIERYNIQNTGLRIEGWHVSDFTSPCLRKSYYGHTEPRAPFDKERGKILWLGNVIHEHTELSQINELTMCYDIVEDVAYPPVLVMGMTDEQRKNIVTGSLDDLIHYNGEVIIGDKKTWNARGWDKQKPDSNYVLQLNIYRVLLKAQLDIDATSGCLLYLDKSSDCDPKPMAFRLQEIEKTKEYLRETLKELQKEKGPDANPCWLCSGENKKGKIFCDYAEKCSSETDRDQQLDLATKLKEYSVQEQTQKAIQNIKATTKLEQFTETDKMKDVAVESTQGLIRKDLLLD